MGVEIHSIPHEHKNRTDPRPCFPVGRASPVYEEYVSGGEGDNVPSPEGGSTKELEAEESETPRQREAPDWVL